MEGKSHRIPLYSQGQVSVQPPLTRPQLGRQPFRIGTCLEPGHKSKAKTSTTTTSGVSSLSALEGALPHAGTSGGGPSWSSFHPTQGTVLSSRLAEMDGKTELRSVIHVSSCGLLPVTCPRRLTSWSPHSCSVPSVQACSCAQGERRACPVQPRGKDPRLEVWVCILPLATFPNWSLWTSDLVHPGQHG